MSPYFGEKLISKQRSKYIPEIGETCFVYKKNSDSKEYYCFTELEYASIAEIQNMLSNSTNFVTTNGWTSRGTDGNSIITLNNYKKEVAGGEDIYYNTLHCAKNEDSIQNPFFVYNDGFFSNRAIFSPNGWTHGEKYVLMVKTNN